MGLNKLFMNKVKITIILLGVQLNYMNSIFQNGLFTIEANSKKKLIKILFSSPENVKNRSDVFYLLPEKATLPTSPIWFSSQPLSIKTLDNMLNRIKMVKEVNELLLAASAPTTTTATS
jgi:predicted lipoprotein